MIVLLTCKLNYTIHLACQTSNEELTAKPHQETGNINLN